MSFNAPPDRTELKWLAVDFDGTIAGSVWPDPGIGEPIRVNVLKLREAARAGWKIVIHTARSWADYEVIESWLNHHEIPFKAIVCGKLLAHRYIDDRAVEADRSVWI